MNITTVPFAVLGIQYKIARFPLQLIEDRVMARMDAESPARLYFERTLGMLDAAVGGALGDSKLAERGSALAERSDALSRAARTGCGCLAEGTARRSRPEGQARRCDRGPEAGPRRKEREVQHARSAAEQRKSAAAEDAKSSAPRRQSSRRTRSPRGAPSRSKRPSARHRPRSLPRRRRPLRPRRPRSTTLRPRAPRPKANVRTRTGSRQLADAEKQKRQSERAE